MSQNNNILTSKGLKVLTKEEKKIVRAKYQHIAWKDMIESLNNYNKYLLLRPTGFGKTYTCACACNIGIQELKDENIVNTQLQNIVNKKVVFVYISQILKETFKQYEKSVIKPFSNGESRVEYITYSLLANRCIGNNDYIEELLSNVGLVIFDEVQRMGAQKVDKALENIVQVLEYKGIPFIGATATIERATGPDVADKYFTKQVNNKKIYCWGRNAFTLNDAFESGLILPPYYVYIDKDTEKLKTIANTQKELIKRLYSEGSIKSVETSSGDKKIVFNTNNPGKHTKTIQNVAELAFCKIENDSEIIKKNMDILYNNNIPNYMRFMVFVENTMVIKDTIVDNEDFKIKLTGIKTDTIEAFQKAFPTMKIKTLTIVSTETQVQIDKKIEKLSTLNKVDNQIDIIFSVNMLNVGYHVHDITGLVFRRWTGSNQVYYQQLGRCLSSSSSTVPIVFDFVNNESTQGVVSPLFTLEEKDTYEILRIDEFGQPIIDVKYNNIKTTYYADGTVKKIDDKVEERFNYIKCNTLDKKYITVVDGTANMHEILNRCNIQIDQELSKKLYSKAYEIYLSKLWEDSNHTRISNRAVCIEDSLRLAVKELYKDKYSKAIKLWINFRPYLQYLAVNNANIAISYQSFLNRNTSGEYNSIATYCKNNTLRDKNDNIINYKLNCIMIIESKYIPQMTEEERKEIESHNIVLREV